MTVDVGIHNHRILSIQQLFNEGPFHIPYFQREYSWSKDHWTEFFGDLTDALEKKEVISLVLSHFERLGLILK